MRRFNDNEIEVMNTLISNNNYASPITIGEILMQVYDISCIEPNHRDEDFYKNTITLICSAKEEPLIYEAISLIVYLTENRYLIAKELLKNEILGEKWSMVPLCDHRANQNEIRLFDFYNFDLWHFLNSQYVALNSLIDLKQHDYQSIDERRFNKTIKWTKISIIVAVIIGLISAVLALLSILINLFNPVKILFIKLIQVLLPC